MFPVETSGPTVDRALAVCESCEVIEPCLDWALSVPEHHGVWGGSTEAERRALMVELRETG